MRSQWPNSCTFQLVSSPLRWCGSSRSTQVSPSGETWVVSWTSGSPSVESTWTNQRASRAHPVSKGSVAKSPEKVVFRSRIAVWDCSILRSPIGRDDDGVEVEEVPHARQRPDGEVEVQQVVERLVRLGVGGYGDIAHVDQPVVELELDVRAALGVDEPAQVVPVDLGGHLVEAHLDRLAEIAPVIRVWCGEVRRVRQGELPFEVFLRSRLGHQRIAEPAHQLPVLVEIGRAHV